MRRGRVIDANAPLAALVGRMPCTQAIYDLLISTRGTQLRHGNRLDELSDQLAENSAKLDEISELLRDRR